MTAKNTAAAGFVKRHVELAGTMPVMFDRYPGDNSTKLEGPQKLYLTIKGIVSLPSLNMISFLSAHNTNSAPKRLRDKRKYKDIANACLSFVKIEPTDLLFLRDGEPIVFDRLGDDGRDRSSGVYLHYSVARLDKGIPNPKVRPVLPLPWSLKFYLTLYHNNEIKEQEVRNLIEEGGHAIGIGTWRGVFGKFIIDRWD